MEQGQIWRGDKYRHIKWGYTWKGDIYGVKHIQEGDIYKDGIYTDMGYIRKEDI